MRASVRSCRLHRHAPSTLTKAGAVKVGSVRLTLSPVLFLIAHVSSQSSIPEYSRFKPCAYVIYCHRTSVAVRDQEPSSRDRGIARRQTSPHAATMPLAERDINTQRQRPLTRGKRLHTAGSVTDENADPPLAIARLYETPTRQQRFFTPTKASAAKHTPSPVTGQPRAQPHSGRITPLSQTYGSKLPRRNLATPTARPAYDPPISKWNLSTATNLKSRPEKVADTLPASPVSPSSQRFAHDRSSLVRKSIQLATKICSQV
jgi:hypothetical protein